MIFSRFTIHQHHFQCATPDNLKPSISSKNHVLNQFQAWLPLIEIQNQARFLKHPESRSYLLTFQAGKTSKTRKTTSKHLSQPGKSRKKMFFLIIRFEDCRKPYNLRHKLKTTTFDCRCFSPTHCPFFTKIALLQWKFFTLAEKQPHISRFDFFECVRWKSKTKV